MEDVADKKQKTTNTQSEVDGNHRITVHSGSRSMAKETPMKSVPERQITKSVTIRRPGVHREYT
jgi:hypothetical protein